MAYTAHVDTFARDNLPPREQWPEFIFELPELQYPPRLNCATVLLDAAVERGWGERTAIMAPDGLRWTYADLLAHANRIARVLVEDCGLVPGNRVLLRAPNNPLHAACWFAVMKAGGIAVGTMPLLRAKELTDVITKAQVSHALCDARLAEELDAARPNCPTLDDGAAVRLRPAGRARRARRGEARDLRQRRHGGRGHRAHRVHVGDDRQAEGHDAFPSRRDRRVRLLSALDAPRLARRPVHRQPAARIHVRIGRTAALSAVDRRGDAARRASGAGVPAAGDRRSTAPRFCSRRRRPIGRWRRRRRITTCRRCGSACRRARRCRRRRASCGRTRPASR